MLCFDSKPLLLVLVLSLFAIGPVWGQSENVTTVEGPQGEKMTVTAQPHSVAEGLSVRAMGIEAPDTTRWALSLIGAPPEADISLTYGDESLPVERISRPEDGIGPTEVYVTQETFLTMAETGTVTLTVGDVTTSLPEQLRKEMQEIFERST